MADGKGYIIPDEPQPDGLYCLKVYIPADDLYLYAFAGAYQFFGKWMAWERDNSQRGKLAAESWRNAIDYTFANGWLNCGDEYPDCEICMSTQELIDLIREALDMNINVSCGGGCGCGCGGTTVAPVDAPPSDYQPTAPVTGGLPEVIEGDALQHKCNMANYLMYALRLAAIQSANFTGGYQSWGDYWGDIFTFVDDPNLTKFQYQPYITIKAALSGIANTQVITIPLDPIYNDLVCSVYSAPNSQFAADNVAAMLAAAYSDYFVRTMMLEIASQLPYDIAFDVASVSSVPPGFSGRDCSQCSGGSADLPIPPAGFVLIPLLASDVVGMTQEGGTNTHSFNESQTQFSYAATDGEWNASSVTINTTAIKARAAVTHLFGCVLEVVSTNASDPDYDNIVELIDQLPGTYNYSLAGKTGIRLARYKSDDYASDNVYQEWIDQFDEISAYGAAEVTIGTSVASWQVSTRHNKTVVYKVWYIGKV